MNASLDDNTRHSRINITDRILEWPMSDLKDDKQQARISDGICHEGGGMAIERLKRR